MKRIIFLLLAIHTFSILAQTDVSTPELLRSINEVSNFFEKERTPTVLCVPPTKEVASALPSCSLAPLCRQVAKNQNSSYLFKTKTGAIPNFIMRDAITAQVSACLNGSRTLLLNQTEEKLSRDLTAADAGTQAAYQTLLSTEYDTLISGTVSPLFSEVGHNADHAKVLAALRRRYLALRDERVLNGLTDSLLLRHSEQRQFHWEELAGDGFVPADPGKVHQTVEAVMGSMKTWLNGRGKEFQGAGVASIFEKMHIIVETQFNQPQSACDRDDIAFYHAPSNSMVICPRGANMPAGGLFAVIAHELGHALSACTPQTNFTTQTTKSWDRVTQCLVNPATGPGPARMDWDGVEAAARAQLADPTQLESVMGQLTQDKAQGQAFACYENQTNFNLQRFNWKTPPDQTQETLADWVSSQVLEEQAKKMKTADAKNFAMEALSTSILKRGCDLSGNLFVPKVQAALRAAGCSNVQDFAAPASMRRDDGGDEHMAPAKRFGVYLQSPTIFKTMGCPGTPRGCK